ncbi:MAG: hypothetical protein ACLP50_35285 [Solirubrobacteraceae bacterium]
MSPLFRKSEEKLARQAAVQAEIDRIKALPPAELAVLVLRGLGPDGPAGGNATRVQQLCEYLLRDVDGVRGLKPLELMARVGRALDLLQRAELATPVSIQRSPVWHLTPVGETTLAEGTVVQRLADVT